MFCFCGCENKNSADLTTQEVAVDESDSSVEEPVAVERVEVDEPGLNGYTICIDAGHQQKGNNEKEPIGPGATETKAKVAGGSWSCKWSYDHMPNIIQSV